MNSHEPRQTRSAQREATREKARQLRESRARKDRNKSRALKLTIAIASVVVVALVALGIFTAQKSTETAKAEPANMSFDGGIKIGSDLQAFTEDTTPAPNATATTSANGAIPNIIVYVDYQCPICQTFEKTNSEQFRSWVNNGVATVEIHPISFLDGRASPNTYSSRAANAALCVANYSPNSYFEFNTALFANQPAEGTPGPENPALIQRAKDVGVQNADKIADCINGNNFNSWLSKTTDRVLNPNYTVPGTDIVIEGTPTVVVNGQKYPLTNESLTSAAMFAQWFLQVTKG
jgi:protein-disulfide isomerase